MISVRRATLDDLEAMQAVYVAAWRDGFRHMFSDVVFAREDFAAARRAECAEVLHDPDADTYVAEIDGHLVGWASAVRGGRSVSIDDVWVHPGSWGSGAAAALVSRIEDEARSAGAEVLSGWVPEDSPRARGFAEKIGWRATGAIEMLAVYPEEPNRMFEYERVLDLFDMTRGLPRPHPIAVEP
jgi:GNAT superfamily N-acetyltransferase